MSEDFLLRPLGWMRARKRVAIGNALQARLDFVDDLRQIVANGRKCLLTQFRTPSISSPPPLWSFRPCEFRPARDARILLSAISGWRQSPSWSRNSAGAKRGRENPPGPA